MGRTIDGKTAATVDGKTPASVNGVAAGPVSDSGYLSTAGTHTFTSNVTVTVTTLYGAGGGAGAAGTDGTVGGNTSIVCTNGISASAYGGGFGSFDDEYAGSDGSGAFSDTNSDADATTHWTTNPTVSTGGGSAGGTNLSGDWSGGNGGAVTSGVFTAKVGQSITVTVGAYGAGGDRYTAFDGVADISWVSR